MGFNKRFQSKAKAANKFSQRMPDGTAAKSVSFFERGLVMGKGHSLTIGDMKFNSKAKAIEFYKNILNSYEADTELNDQDYDAVLSLCKIQWLGEEDVSIIDNIIVHYHPAHKSTKCFQIIIDGYCHMFSYRDCINSPISQMQSFSKACRNAIKNQLKEYKKEQFKNRPVKCAISNEIVEWEDCQIDHKAPLTFSVIVKSFIVANNIDLDSVEYTFENLIHELKDIKLIQKFCDFHIQMAVLRVLSSESNIKLSSSARISPTKKDRALVDL